MNAKEFVQALFDWYRENKRDLPWRRSHDPYAIWISEVMLQQTSVASAIPYYERFLSSFPDLDELADAPLGKVLKCWEGLGYYSRARNLHAAANEVRSKYGGRIPSDYEELRKLPGIGDYTASAIASIAYGSPFPVVDGNVWRAFSRILAIRDDQTKGKKKVREHLMRIINGWDPSTFNQAIMELGSLICSPRNPVCEKCPVRSFCLAFQQKKINEFPRKPRKKSLPHQDWVCVAVLRQGKMFVRKRDEKGIWGGLWEFPSFVLETGGEKNIRNGIKKLLLELDIKNFQGKKRLEIVRHAFSHFKLTLHPFVLELRGKQFCPREGEWVDLRHRDYAMPVPHLKIVQAIVSFLRPSSFKAESAR